MSSRKKSSGDHYEVGYGKPPVHSRWKPDQSGNPKGRRRRSTDVAEWLDAEMQGTLKATVGGKTQTIYVAQAVARVMLQETLKGKPSAMKEVLRLQNKRREQFTHQGWTIIEARPVFENEENRLMQLTRENERLREQFERLKSLMSPEQRTSLAPVDVPALRPSDY